MSLRSPRASRFGAPPGGASLRGRGVEYDRGGRHPSLPPRGFVKDDETRFVVVNEMMCALMGKPYEELVGKTDYDFVPKQHAKV